MSEFVEAVESGDRRLALEALRGKLARAIEVSDPEKIAPLATRLQAVVDALDGLSDAEGGSAVDDIAAQREKRRAASSSAV